MRAEVRRFLSLAGMTAGSCPHLVPWLTRRPTAACVLRPEGESLVVLLGDRSLRMPARLTAPMELVASRTTFRVADLAPWLDASSRLVVARRLVREGLLRIAE